MFALVSDIHGNLEAIEAVEGHVAGTDIVCLGDVIGYGPDSIECVRKSSNWKSTIAGPFDLALLDHNPEQWNPTLNLHLERLSRSFDHSKDAEFLYRVLESYGTEFTIDGRWFFHGQPANVRGWVFPEDVYCPSVLDEKVAHTAHAFIGGGSHIPGVFRRTCRGWEFTIPVNGESYELPPGEKTIITLGSVGQPRDGDSRAAYAMIDESSVVFHRIDYDIETTIRKIKDDPEVDDMHGERLSRGC